VQAVPEQLEKPRVEIDEREHQPDAAGHAVVPFRSVPDGRAARRRSIAASTTAACPRLQ
jgi:hypothetical protein